jgi:hypothetical protein
VKVLEVDQWTSTGNVEEFNFETFELQNVQGGDSLSARLIFGGHAAVKDVEDTAEPTIGHVWYVEAYGKFIKWKVNYDSSD